MIPKKKDDPDGAGSDSSMARRGTALFSTGKTGLTPDQGS
jgi:hypothetical protein